MNKNVIIQAVSLKWRLCRLKRPIVAFDIPSLGEAQFILPVLSFFRKVNPEDSIILVHNTDHKDDFLRINPEFQRDVIHTEREVLNILPFSEINLFLTSEQYDRGLDCVYSISMFHGHAAKGLSFVPEVIKTFDGLFLLGPVHKEAFLLYLEVFLRGEKPSSLDIYDVGYPKSDRILKGFYDSKVELKNLNLDTKKQTLLYAPAFNEGASLREWGLDIIQILAGLVQYNVLVKLPIDCWQPTTNYYATGGVDWFKEISELEKKYSNLRLFGDYQIDPLLACSDILITCISSVSFEFLALNKPVIFIDTPAYFQGFLKRWFPHLDTSDWANKTTVNGGKEFGLVVEDIKDLPEAIIEVFNNYQNYPLQQDRLQQYLLYNRGHAAEAAVNQIMDILATGKKTRRSMLNGQFIRNFWRIMPKPFQEVVRSFITPKRVLKKLISTTLNRSLQAFGYRVEKTGLGYLEPKKIIFEAKKANLTICEFLENSEKDRQKVGRRDRIIHELERRVQLSSCNIVLEIGAGTGMYLEKVMQITHPDRYEIYETHRGWVKYLKSTFGRNSNCRLIFHNANGKNLEQTDSNTCQLVHAHGVFVYIPFLTTLTYISEAARVLSSGGYLIFDCYTENCMSIDDVKKWLSTSMSFPVIIPKSLIMEHTANQGLTLVESFFEVHGCSRVDYYIFKK